MKFYALILVLVMGTLGFAYAAWVDGLVIAGTVNTGDIDVQFTDAVVCFDQSKDIASGSADISADGKTLTVTIDNYYPCAGGKVYYLVENFGSVPVHLEDKIITVNEPIEGMLTVTNCGKKPKDPCPDPDDPDCPPDWDYPGLEEGTQLGEDHAIAQGVVTFDLAQYVEECGTEHDTMNKTITFDIELDFIQYNKSRH